MNKVKVLIEEDNISNNSKVFTWNNENISLTYIYSQDYSQEELLFNVSKLLKNYIDTITLNEEK